MRRALTLALAATLLTGGAFADDFSHLPPGDLIPGSGKGRPDETIYVPGLRFPIESAPAFLNSQVYSPGGSVLGGSQCAPSNYAYPWRDNYCESRKYDMPLCPAGSGHQGQDIRAASCKKGTHWVVSPVDGVVSILPHSYVVTVFANDGTAFRLMHMSDLQVEWGDEVTRGKRLGKVSNVFGTTPTTVHLHFDIQQNLDGHGYVYVPPYLSLVDAYQRLLDGLEPIVTDEPDVDGGKADQLPSSDEPASATRSASSGCAFVGAPPSRAPIPLLLLSLGLVLARAHRRRPHPFGET